MGIYTFVAKEQQHSQKTKNIVLVPRARLVETVEERNGLLGAAPEMEFQSYSVIIWETAISCYDLFKGILF